LNEHNRSCEEAFFQLLLSAVAFSSHQVARSFLEQGLAATVALTSKGVWTSYQQNRLRGTQRPGGRNFHTHAVVA
jgi:hypothetical protein